MLSCVRNGLLPAERPRCCCSDRRRGRRVCVVAMGALAARRMLARCSPAAGRRAHRVCRCARCARPESSSALPARRLEDAEYRRFVEATGFEYRRDLDAVILRGEKTGGGGLPCEARLDENRLRQYFLAHGGRCFGGLCSMQGSLPERQISWVRPGAGDGGIAVSPDPLAAAVFTDEARKHLSAEWRPPDAPLWLYVPAPCWKRPKEPRRGWPWRWPACANRSGSSGVRRASGEESSLTCRWPAATAKWPGRWPGVGRRC